MHFDPSHIVSKPKRGQKLGKTIRIKLVSDPLTVGHPTPFHTPLWAGPKIQGPAALCMTTMGGRNHHKHNPHKLHHLPVLKRAGVRVLETAKKSVVGGVGWSCTILDIAEISSYDHTPQHLHRDAPPPYSIHCA